MVLLPLAGVAGPSSEKAAQRRAEAEDLAQKIAEGANAQSLANRIKFLSEERAASAELAGVLGKSVDPAQRRNIVQALAILASPAAEQVLLSVLSDSDGAVRMYAVQGLGRMGSRATDKMRVLLGDPTLGVRREAARALGAAHQPKMAKALLSAAKAEGEPEVRSAMLVAAGECGDAKQAKALEAFLANSSESTRFAAARGLCLLGAPAGFAFAKELLSSKEPTTRRSALSLLEGTKAKQAAPLLRPLLADADKALAAGAARILYEGGDGSMLEWLVLASHHAGTDDKLRYEAELEKLRLADDQRRAILAKAGIK
ncbi:MAG: HEAT repeat domain-containing protein [Myxococcales bacterium]|nr:HEAT repeat domain-containing protein [Myxococcales bacterium]